MFAIQTNRPANREIGAFAYQMELLKPQELIRNGETDCTVIANLDVLNVSKEIAEIADDFELARLSQWTL